MRRALLISLAFHLILLPLVYAYFNYYHRYVVQTSLAERKRQEEKKQLSRREFTARADLKKKLDELLEKKYQHLDPRRLDELKAKLKEPEKLKELARLLAEREKIINAEKDLKKRAELRNRADEEVRKIFEGLRAEYEKEGRLAEEQLRKEALKRKYVRAALETGLPRVRAEAANILMHFEPRDMLSRLWNKLTDASFARAERLVGLTPQLVRGVGAGRSVPAKPEGISGDWEKMTTHATQLSAVLRENAKLCVETLAQRERNLGVLRKRLEDVNSIVAELSETVLAIREDIARTEAAEKLADKLAGAVSTFNAQLQDVHDSLRAADRTLTQTRLDKSAEEDIVKHVTGPLRAARPNAPAWKKAVRAGQSLEETKQLPVALAKLLVAADKIHRRQREVLESGWSAVAAEAALTEEVAELASKAESLKTEELRFSLEYEGVTSLASATADELRLSFREYALEESQGEIDGFRVQLRETLLRALRPSPAQTVQEPDKKLEPVAAAFKNEMDEAGKKAARDAADKVAGEVLAEGGLAAAAANPPATADGPTAAEAMGGPSKSEGEGGISGVTTSEATPGAAGENALPGGSPGEGGGEALLPGGVGPAGENDKSGGMGDLAQALAGNAGDDKEGALGPASIGFARKGEHLYDLTRAMDRFDESEYSRVIAYTARYKPPAPPPLRQVEPTATFRHLQSLLGAKTAHAFAAFLYIESDERDGPDGNVDIKGPAEFNVPENVGKYFAGIPYFDADPILDARDDESVWRRTQTTSVWLPHNPGPPMIRMGWNSRGLWGFMNVKDRSGEFDAAGSNQFWNGDTLELWFDMRNTKAVNIGSKASENSQQLWLWPQRGGELWEAHRGGGPLNLRGHEKKRGNFVAANLRKPYDGYELEFLIPREALANLDRFRAGNILGFHYCLNHGWRDEQDDVFVHTKFGAHSDHPQMWGNLMLAGTDARLTLVDQNGRALTLPRVEIGSPMFIEVRDPDRDLDPNGEDRLTCLVSVPGGDWEGVELTEVGRHSGTFRGAVLTTFELTHAGDGALTLAAGERVEISYFDQFRDLNKPERKLTLQVPAATPIYRFNFEREAPARMRQTIRR